MTVPNPPSAPSARRRLGAALLAALCLAAPAAAEVRELHLSVAACVDLALEHSTRIVQDQYATQIADLQVRSAHNAFLPSLSASYGFSRQVSGPREGSFLDPATGLLVTTRSQSQTSGSQSVGAGASMTLYDQSNFARLAASQEGRRVASLNQSLGRQEVALEVKRGYFGLLQALDLLEVQRDQVGLLDETLRRAEALHEMRSAPVSDVLSARASLESARASYISRQNSAEVARGNLAFSIGLDTETRVEPAERHFEIQPVDLTFEAARDQALASHPQLEAQRHALLQALEDLKATRYAGRLPSLRASAGYSWRLASNEEFDGFGDLFRKNYGLSAGVSLSVPVYDRRATDTSVRTQQLNYLRSLETYHQTQRQVALEVQQALLALEQYRRSIAASQTAVNAAEENYHLAQERYDLGTGTLLERLQAQTSLGQAKSGLVQARYSYQTQLAVLEAAVGGVLAAAR
ncbi:MAG: TolC family protein [Gemmatimonadota bacterium]